MTSLTKRWLLAATALIAAAAATPALAAGKHATHDQPLPWPAVKHTHRRASKASSSEDKGAATGLGQLSGVLPRSKLTLESAIEINLSKEYARLPIYPGTAPNPTDPSQTERVWYILEDASDSGNADDLGVNYAPKLNNMAISCPECVQTVTEENPSPEDNHFGPAVIHFQGAPEFTTEREAVPGPTGFPLKSFKPGAFTPPGDPYTPFIRIAGSDVIYNAPIVAVGEGPFDVTTHSNTSPRVLGIHIGTEAHAPSGQFGES
jgi:hypothetical protein